MTFPTYEEWGEKVAEQVSDYEEWGQIEENEVNEVLDKIRAEIEQYNQKPSHYPIDMISIETVLQIIDKYRKGANK